MKRLAMALFAVAVVAVVGVVPAAADSACEQACEDTFNQDVEDCDTRFTEQLAEIDADEAGCVSKPNPEGCLNSIAKRRRNAIRQNENCLRVAEQVYENCLKDCDVTPARKR